VLLHEQQAFASCACWQGCRLTGLCSGGHHHDFIIAQPATRRRVAKIS
jgi:hypothetical protein